MKLYWNYLLLLVVFGCGLMLPLTAQDPPKNIASEDPFSGLLSRETFFGDKYFGINEWEKTSWEAAFGGDPGKDIIWDVWSRKISAKEYTEKYHLLSAARHDWIEAVYKKHKVSFLTRIKVISTDKEKFILSIAIGREKNMN